MDYLIKGMYIMAACIVAFGISLYVQMKKREKIGEKGVGTATYVQTSGFGIFKKYNASITYKVGKKKIKGDVTTKFYQPITKNRSIQIRYEVSNPTEVVARDNDAYRLFNVIGAAIFIIANFLDVLF